MSFQNNSADGIGYIKLGNRIVPREFLSSIDNNFQSSGSGEVETPQGWNLSTLTYTENKLSISSEEALPQSIYVNPDGTKLYLIGRAADTVFQYTFTTPWDMTTLSYDSKSKDVSTETDTGQGIFFKPDGTVMYVGGDETGNSAIFQYTLSTPWDVSTASYDSKTISVESQDSGLQSIFLKDDGTKLYFFGNSGGSIYQYTLSTPWDVSTASYDSKSLSVSSEDSFMKQFYIKPDGTKLYSMGLGFDMVHEYDLSTPWDVSTGSYNDVYVNIPLTESIPTGMTISIDGFKMFISDNSSDSIYEFTMTE